MEDGWILFLDLAPMSFHPLADGGGDDVEVRVLDRLVAIASKKCA